MKKSVWIELKRKCTFDIEVKGYDSGDKLVIVIVDLFGNELKREIVDAESLLQVQISGLEAALYYFSIDNAEESENV